MHVFEGKECQFLVSPTLFSSQINGEFDAKGRELVKYLAKMEPFFKDFPSFGIIDIARLENYQVDALSKSTNSAHKWIYRDKCFGRS